MPLPGDGDLEAAAAAGVRRPAPAPPCPRRFSPGRSTLPGSVAHAAPSRLSPVLGRLPCVTGVPEDAAAGGRARTRQAQAVASAASGCVALGE